MSADPVMNTSGPTVTLMFFSMSLAMYLYKFTLLECSCSVMISVHLIV